jgi:hypothetical protein
MAVIVSADERFDGWVELAAIDTNGVRKKRKKFFELSDAVTTDAEARAAMVALLPLLDAVNEADIVAWHFGVTFPWDGTATTVVGNLQREAILTLVPDTPGDLVTHTIYAPDDTIVSGNNVNEADADLVAYLNLFETGGDFVLSDGESIVAANQIASSRLRTKGSNK